MNCGYISVSFVKPVRTALKCEIKGEYYSGIGRKFEMTRGRYDRRSCIMGEEIFRKKSLEKIKSPDDMHDYIRVTDPAVWLILIAAIVLLIGAFVWGSFGSIETHLDADISVTGHVAEGTMDSGDLRSVKTGMPVYADDVEGAVETVDIASGTFTAVLNVPDGVYEGYIVTENIRPLKFLFN